MTKRQFDGWKAIAAHMNRSVRQCQRLAESSDLPIHKLPGSRAVFAFQEDLDVWIAGGDASTVSEVDARISRSGQHVILPVDLVETLPTCQKPGQGLPVGVDKAVLQGRRQTIRRVVVVSTAMLVGLVLLAVGPGFRSASHWRTFGVPMTGEWTLTGGGVEGTSRSIGRFDTGHLFGPGASATVDVQSEGTRWSGGLEIFEDDLHWTFVSVSPRQREVTVYRFPTGTVNSIFVGSRVSPGTKVRLSVALSEKSLDISCGTCREASIPLDRGDVSSGRLLLRVGSSGDEIHEPSGGRCRFTDLEVHGSPATLPLTLVEEVPVKEMPRASYSLTVDNVDDQIDILLDGRRLASAGYRERIGPLVLDPFLSQGGHTLTARVFNRKWTAAYGIALSENDTEIWNPHCGDVQQLNSGCEEIGNRLGLVKELSYSFDAR